MPKKLYNLCIYTPLLYYLLENKLYNILYNFTKAKRGESIT